MLILIIIEQLSTTQSKVSTKDLGETGVIDYKKLNIYVNRLVVSGHVVKGVRRNTYFAYPLTLTTKGSIVVATAKRILEGRPIRKPSVK